MEWEEKGKSGRRGREGQGMCKSYLYIECSIYSIVVYSKISKGLCCALLLLLLLVGALLALVGGG